MNDITYCLSRYCENQEECMRHYSNNELKGKVYSACDFECKGECEFFIPRKEDCNYKCDNCGEDLTNEPKVGVFGCRYIVCDNCGEENYIDELEPETLTKDNIRFPQHYYHFRDGVSIDDDTINEWVKKCIEYLEQNPNEDHILTASGDSLVHVTRFEGDGEYNVQVCKNYYETCVKINS